MPIEDLVHVGVSLIADQSGTALKCRWMVYVGSVDLVEESLDLHGRSLTAGEAADEALREGVRWLEVQAASKRAAPSVPPPEEPPVEDADQAAAPQRPPRRRATQPKAASTGRGRATGARY